MENYTFLFLKHLQTTKNLSPKSISAYQSDLKQFIRHQPDLFNPNLHEYISYLNRTLRLKDSSIHRKIITLKNFYNFLVEQDLLSISPFSKLHFRFRQEKRLPKTLPLSDVAKLLNCFDIAPATLTPFKKQLFFRDSALIELLVCTGIRIGEAAAITLDDIIQNERTILIHGKGRKQRLIYISSTVSWERLNQLIKLRKKAADSIYLFVNRNGKPISTHGIEDIYKKYIKIAQLNKKSTPHYLRHTLATNLLANGADLRSVQEILGHASVATTQIYTEVTTNRKKQILKKYNYRNKL